jgi:hypothetical protein
MFKRQCPQCGSARIRRGYQDPPLFLRLLGIYQFLCDGCNLLYKGFAVPGTVPQLPPPGRTSTHARMETSAAVAAPNAHPAPGNAEMPQALPQLEQDEEEATAQQQTFDAEAEKSGTRVSTTEIDVAFERFMHRE